MVSKLALVRVGIEEERTRPPDPSRLYRLEIQQVIVDTELLVTGKVPLDEWLESA